MVNSQTSSGHDYHALATRQCATTEARVMHDICGVYCGNFNRLFTVKTINTFNPQ